jgi:hypothetical protein
LTRSVRKLLSDFYKEERFARVCPTASATSVGRITGFSSDPITRIPHPG